MKKYTWLRPCYSDYVTLYYFDQLSLLKLASDSWKLVQLVNSDV